MTDETWPVMPTPDFDAAGTAPQSYCKGASPTLAPRC